MLQTNKRNVEAEPAQPRRNGAVLDAGFQPVRLQPGLDCQPVLQDDSKELWLLQLPLDFDATQASSWTVVKDGADGFRARCSVDGAEFNLVQDNEAMTMQMFAAPSAEGESAVPVNRRMVVARTTEAPQLCFGVGNAEPPVKGRTAPAASAPQGAQGDGGGKKKKRKQSEGEESKKAKKKKSK